MAGSTVSVRIALEGGPQVKAQLKELGTAFEQIGSAAGRLASAFQRFGAASQSFNQSINRVVGQTARIGLAIAGAATSVALLAKSSADSAKEIQALADQLGTTTDRVQQLQGLFARAGVAPDQLTQSLTGVQQAFRGVRDEFATPLPGQPKAVETFNDLGITVRRFGDTLKTPAFDQFGRKLADGVRPAVETFDEFGITVRRFGDAYKNTAAAVTNNPLAKLAGLTGLDLTKAIGESPEKQLFRVMDALSKVQDTAERVNIAKGLGIGPELLTVIKGGADELRSFADRLKVTFDPKTIADEQKLAAAFVNLRFVATQTKNAMGAVFSEGGQGASAIDSFTRLIEDNRAGLVQFARDVRNVVVPEVQNFVLLLSGKEVPETSIFAGLKVDIPAAAAVVREAVQGVIVPAFRALYAGAQQVSIALKEFTGKDVSASAILIGAAFLQLTGVFRLLGTAIGLARASVLLLLVPFRVLGTVILAVASAVNAGIILPFSAVGAVFGSTAQAILLFAARVAGIISLAALLTSNWQTVKDFFASLFTGIGEIWQGEFTKGLDTLKQTFLSAFNGLKDASVSTWLQIASSALVFFGPGGLLARAILTGLVAAVTLAFDSVKSVVTNAVAGISGPVIQAFDFLKVGGTLDQQILAFARSVADNLVAAFDFLKIGGGLDQSIAAFAGRVFAPILNAAQTIFALIRDVAEQDIARVLDALQRIGATTAFQTLSAAVTTVFNAIASFVVPIWTTIDTAAQSAFQSILTGAQTLLSALTSAFSGVASAITSTFGGIVAAAQAVVSSLTAAFTGAASSITSAFSSIADGLKAAFDSAITSIIGRIDALIQKIRSVGSAIAGAFSNPGNTGNTGNPAGDVGGFASGGHIRGRGTGTSDSILARLSNGEFVIRAAIVQRLGVPLLNAINAGRLNLRDLLPGFSSGGLASARMPRFELPRFATGGLVNVPAVAGGGGSSLAPVNLHIGGTVIEGLMAPDDVIRKLSRAASTSRAVATGRQPSWQGGV